MLSTPAVLNRAFSAQLPELTFLTWYSDNFTLLTSCIGPTVRAIVEDHTSDQT